MREAIDHPRSIDEHLVNAQQARRILDRLVGYKISPLLWRRVQKHTSAGRVQSVAVRLIVDREEQIKNFVAEEYWTLTAFLSKLKERKTFEAELVRRLDQSEKEKLRIGSQEEMDAIVESLRGAGYRGQGGEAKDPERGAAAVQHQLNAARRLDPYPLLAEKSMKWRRSCTRASISEMAASG